MVASRIAAQRERGPHGEGSGVTAVVCTHRGEAYLASQLASILRQSTPVDEVIVSDDASSDGTVELATRTLEAADTAFRVYTRDAALRVAANFAFGIEQALTPIVAFADQDDVWHVDKVARLAPLFADEGALVVHSDARLVDQHGDELEPSLLASLEITDAEWAGYLGDARDARGMRTGVGPGPDQFGVLLRRNLVTGATTMVRRDFAVSVGVAPAPWIHDEWLAIAASLRSGVRALRDPLMDYRQHGQNQIGQVTPTLRDKLGRVVGAGYDQQVRRVERAEALRHRLTGLGATAEQRVELERKLSHERRRLGMRDARLARIPAIARGLRRGDYGRYSSRGTLDVIRDALHSRSDRTDDDRNSDHAAG